MNLFKIDDLFFLKSEPFQSTNSDSRRRKSSLPRLGGTSSKYRSVNG